MQTKNQVKHNLTRDKLFKGNVIHDVVCNEKATWTTREAVAILHGRSKILFNSQAVSTVHTRMSSPMQPSRCGRNEEPLAYPVLSGPQHVSLGIEGVPESIERRNRMEHP